MVDCKLSWGEKHFGDRIRLGIREGCVDERLG